MELNTARQEASCLSEIKRQAHEYAEIAKKKSGEDIEAMKDLVKNNIVSDVVPKKKEKMRNKSLAPRQRDTTPQAQPQQVQPPQNQGLIQKSYTEQLKQRLREQQLHRLMSDIFG